MSTFIQVLHQQIRIILDPMILKIHTLMFNSFYFPHNHYQKNSRATIVGKVKNNSQQELIMLYAPFFLASDISN